MMNPSCNLDNGLKGFPAVGDPPFSAAGKDSAIAELIAVGFPRGSWKLTAEEHEVWQADSEAGILAQDGCYSPAAAQRSGTEWITKYRVKAEMYRWKFARYWYYWAAEVRWPDFIIPKALAEDFNKRFRREVRVDGFAGGQNVTRDVGSYHIDTLNGLKEFMRLLKQNYEAVREHQKGFLAKAREKMRGNKW